MELARLRVLDIDFEGNLLVVRTGKGDKDRSTILSDAVKEPLRLHMDNVKALHERDLSAGQCHGFESSIKVTGPSLTSETCITAANSP